jgi:hypothetical protein
MVHDPSFVIVLLSGLLTGSTEPFFFVGLVQYFSKMPSLSHFCFDRCKDSTRTPLCHRQVSSPGMRIQWRLVDIGAHLSEMD